jgi:NDP-sugar pyrophosphorylase family protein
MKAMIFAAGLGTRLKPLTDHCPKALVEVDGRTLLDRTIDRLVGAGATEIVVNVHHFAEQVIRHLDTHSYPVSIRVSDESDALLDTGGGLRKAAPLFCDDETPILIHNVDILHNADLPAFYAAAQTTDVLLMVSRRQTTRYLLFDDDGRLRGWTNIATGEVRSPYAQLNIDHLHRYAFAGIHCIAPRAIRHMTDFPEKFPIMDFYLQRCKDIHIRAYPVDNLRLLDVGKTDSLQQAHDFLAVND